MAHKLDDRGRKITYVDTPVETGMHTCLQWRNREGVFRRECPHTCVPCDPFDEECCKDPRQAQNACLTATWQCQNKASYAREYLNGPAKPDTPKPRKVKLIVRGPAKPLPVLMIDTLEAEIDDRWQ